MINQLIFFATIIIAVVGFYLLVFLWGNASLKSIFDRFGAIEVISHIQLKESFRIPLHYVISKRIFDLFFALFTLLFTFPLLLIASTAIKLDSKGPILYKQRRTGINGSTFWTYKFRTMSVTEDDLSSDLHKFSSDNRITRVGYILRRTAIDELPILISVLRGNMSLVGRSRIIENDTLKNILPPEGKNALLRIKPGLVSLGALSKDRLTFNYNQIYNYDMHYLLNMSLGFDMKIFVGSAILLVGLTSEH
jgi:putative colanic acid biosynthesis UDP-glucose lipid carrier transferase